MPLAVGIDDAERERGGDRAVERVSAAAHHRRAPRASRPRVSVATARCVPSAAGWNAAARGERRRTRRAGE